jgi:hypothetical protein
MLKLRIISPNGSRRHTADVKSRKWGKFAITRRHQGKERTTDIPLSSAAIETLAFEAMPRDLDIAGLIGQVLVAAINKDMIHKILGD